MAKETVKNHYEVNACMSKQLQCSNNYVIDCLGETFNQRSGNKPVKRSGYRAKTKKC